MSEATDALYAQIEKAKGLLSPGARQRLVSSFPREVTGKNIGHVGRLKRAIDYIDDRNRKGGRTWSAQRGGARSPRKKAPTGPHSSLLGAFNRSNGRVGIGRVPNAPKRPR